MAGGIWVLGQSGPNGGIARISAEIATLARSLGEAGVREVTGIVIGSDPGAAATELATFVPRVIAVADPALAGHASATIVAQRLVALAATDQPDVILCGADPEGRDIAGATAALLGWPILARSVKVASAVRWAGCCRITRE